MLTARLLPLAAVVLAAAAVAPASAQSQLTQIVPLTDLFKAYKAICFDHSGDAKKQVSVAQAAPFKMTETSRSADGTVMLKGGELFANILDSGDQRYCMVTARVAEATTAEQGRAIADPLLGKIATGTPYRETAYAWTSTRNGQVTAYLYSQRSFPEQVLASYLLGVEKKK